MNGLLHIAVIAIAISNLINVITIRRQARVLRELWLDTRTRPPP